MSDIVLAIIAFVAFSVITDVIEGKKKRQEGLPSEGERAESIDRKDKEIVIPPIQHIPSQYEQQGADGVGVVNLVHKRNIPREAVIAADSNYDEVRPLKAADIHWNVLLNAVAYTQILQPPKAYQYMMTKSCRGEWRNDK